MTDLARVTPHPKPAAKRSPTKKATKQGALWRDAVLRQADVLYAVDEPAHPSVQAHHIIYRQVCRKHNAPEWDPRNGVPVSGRRHSRHHSGHEPIRWGELSPPVQENVRAFAAEFGLTPWLERHLGGFPMELAA